MTLSGVFELRDGWIFRIEEPIPVPFSGTCRGLDWLPASLALTRFSQGASPVAECRPLGAIAERFYPTSSWPATPPRYHDTTALGMGWQWVFTVG
jgi:hypothetical protein